MATGTRPTVGTETVMANAGADGGEPNEDRPEAIRACRTGMPADAITPITDTVIVRPDPTNV